MNRFDRWFLKLQFGHGSRVKFYREFAGLLGANMSKRDALTNMYVVASFDGTKKKRTAARVIEEILKAMTNGERFGPAISPWVPSDDAMVLEASEMSDKFDEQIRAYVETLNKKRKIRGTIIGGLLYPSLMFSMIYGLLIYFGNSVVPEIGKLLDPSQWQGAAAFLAFLGDFAKYYAVPGFVTALVTLIVVAITLPRWSGAGRKWVEGLPIYSMYRMYTGISFLLAISSLMRGGLQPVTAVERTRSRANPYVRTRITMIYGQMLNGENLGSAMAATKTNWPDAEMNLSIKTFSKGRDLADQMAHMSQEWLDRALEKVSMQTAMFRNFALGLTFFIILSIVFGMYSLQGQISTAAQAGAY